jgi:hypothetical protein
MVGDHLVIRCMYNQVNIFLIKMKDFTFQTFLPGLETAYLGGFYRGCYLTENMNVAVCDYMEIYYKSIGNVTWCTRCGTDDCNDNLP